jgi:hypothetical protein
VIENRALGVLGADTGARGRRGVVKLPTGVEGALMICGLGREKRLLVVSAAG